MPKRLAYTAPYKAEVLEYKEARLKENEVLIKTELASGKHGTTFAMFDGGTFKGQDFNQDYRIFEENNRTEARMSYPMDTGNIGVGTIIKTGSKVSKWKKGDRILTFMDIRETSTCPEDGFIWLLENIEPELALCTEPAYVAFHCIRESNVRYGERVAVFGLGALGLLSIRMAALSNAETIFAVDPIENRREWALNNGADYAYDPSEGDIAKKIHELTDGKGVDVAIEVSGAYPALAEAIRSVRVGGTVCSAGFYQKPAHDMWLGREWHHNRLTMIVPHGCGWGHPPRDYPGWDEKRGYDTLVSLMKKGKLTAPGLIRPIGTIDEGPEIIQKIKEHPEEVIKFAIKF